MQGEQLQACQKLRPHVGQASVLVSKSLVLMLSLTVVAGSGCLNSVLGT